MIRLPSTTSPSPPILDPEAWARAFEILQKNPAFWAIWTLLLAVIIGWTVRPGLARKRSGD